MKPITTNLRHPRFDCGAEFRVSYDHEPRHQYDFGDTATVVISTGCCTLQTYGTPSDLRAVAASLMLAADAVEQANQKAA